MELECKEMNVTGKKYNKEKIIKLEKIEPIR